MKKLIFIIMTFFFSQILSAADFGINPEFLKIKVFKFAVSTSPYCTDLITVFEKPDPVYEDVLTNPHFGSGTLANGVYPCVVIEMSDTVKFASEENSTSGNCIASNEETLEVCTSEFPNTIRLIDGTTGSCFDGEQKIAIYLTTIKEGDAGGPFLPPVEGNHGRGLLLGAPLVVADGVIAKFIVNGMGKIWDDSFTPRCEMNAPNFSFTHIIE